MRVYCTILSISRQQVQIQLSFQWWRFYRKFCCQVFITLLLLFTFIKFFSAKAKNGERRTGRELYNNQNNN